MNAFIVFVSNKTCLKKIIRLALKPKHHTSLTKILALNTKSRKKSLVSKQGFLNCLSMSTKFLKEVLLSIPLSKIMRRIQTFLKNVWKSVSLKPKGLKKNFASKPKL